MKDFNLNSITNGISVLTVPANRFKTNEISIVMATPLQEETASINAVLVNLLARSTRKYPTMLSLNRKLDLLYGASVSGNVSKYGDKQILALTISSLDDRFSIENDSISAESLELLFSMLFDPDLDENGYFSQESIDIEKRVLIDKINGEYNEKRIYALRRCEEIMFEGEPFSINKFGTIDAVNKVTKDDLKNALERIVKSAKICVACVGNANEENIISLTKNAFSSIEREYTEKPYQLYKNSVQEVKDITERMDVKQGKLVLGFRVSADINDSEATNAIRALADVFGGGPYSKLFVNVREKLSLCYYCSARYDRRNGSIIVQCGCEEENMDKAIAEILNQLDAIKNGSFDDELDASKMGLCDSIRSVDDDSVYLLNWYTSQVADDEIKSPEKSANNHLAVTKEQIVNSASLVALDTVYRLCSTKEGE